jgi:hypothetical protein
MEHATVGSSAEFIPEPDDATVWCDVASSDDGTWGEADLQATLAGIRPRHGGKGQAARRREERDLRMRAVLFRQRARAHGVSAQEMAAVLDLAPRTLSSWSEDFRAGHLEARQRGRPPQHASAERSAAVMNFLAHQGPSLSLATLKAEYPDVSRAELSSLRGDFCACWRRTHRVERCELTWLYPGRVWAMDFSHPPHLIDGCFRAIFNVVDLASHQQLLWLPVDRCTRLPTARATTAAVSGPIARSRS